MTDTLSKTAAPTEDALHLDHTLSLPNVLHLALNPAVRDVLALYLDAAATLARGGGVFPGTIGQLCDTCEVLTDHLQGEAQNFIPLPFVQYRADGEAVRYHLDGVCSAEGHRQSSERLLQLHAAGGSGELDRNLGLLSDLHGLLAEAHERLDAGEAAAAGETLTRVLTVLAEPRTQHSLEEADETYYRQSITHLQAQLEAGRS